MSGYVILTPGTKIATGGYEGAPGMVLKEPAVALFHEKYVYENAFIINSLTNQGGRPVKLPPQLSGDRAVLYVIGQLTDFAQGETAERAWAAYRKKLEDH